MQIRWLRLALSDLDEVATYIAESNPKAATQIVKTIWDRTKVLSSQPYIGRAGRVAKTRELIIDSFIIPYRIADNEVQILRVLHSARDWPKEF